VLLLGLDEVVLAPVLMVVICVDDGVDDDVNTGVVLELVDAALELVDVALELVDAALALVDAALELVDKTLELVDKALELIEVVELPTDGEYQSLLWVLLCANARPIRPAKRQLLSISARMVSSVANEIGV
jgi:hypothetical protein